MEPGSIFWIANKNNKLALAKNEEKKKKKFGAKQYHFLWYNPKMEKQKLTLDKDKLFKGEVPVAVFTNQKNEPNDIWIAAKAGTNGLPHGHLDVGNFELTLNGVRWILDMGSDNYNLPGYWHGEVGGKRWSYPRLTTESHNVPMIDGKGQIENASASVEKFVSKKTYGFWILDMSKLYAGNNTIKRGVAIFDNRDQGMIRDEFKMAKDSAIEWSFMTKANVTIKEKAVELYDKKSKKTLTVKFKSNATKIKINTDKIPYEEPAKSTDGYTKVTVTFVAKAHELTYINAKFANFFSKFKGAVYSDFPRNENLSNWK